MERSSQGDLIIIDAVDDHIQKYIGDVAIVFHEEASPDIHVDIFHVAPSQQRPFHTLITCGMSEKPMTTPEGWEDGRLAELMICLPELWPVNVTAFQNEEYFWPVRVLKALTRYPHENNTWLYAGHSVRCSNPPRPFAANTKMTSVLVRYPCTIPADATIIHASDDRQIRLWTIVPLYKEEWEFKNRCGFEALDELLNENGITELLDPERNSVALEH
jgi:hypothetical protein